MTITFSIFYLLITNNIENSYYRKLNKTIEQNFCEQARYYHQLSKANNDLRRFKHDFNNLKIGLTVCYKNNDTKGALKYLEDCSGIISSDYILFNTGNHIIDALLSDKAYQTRGQNITITFDGIVPSNILSPVDICIIFGNALDNAIEACCKIPYSIKKDIKINFKKASDYVFIKISNPVANPVNISNNTISTTKKDKSEHGLGLYSIKNIVEKYDGTLRMTCTNNIFKLEISLHMDDSTDGEITSNSSPANNNAKAVTANNNTATTPTDKTAISSKEDKSATDVNNQTTATTSTDKTTVSSTEDKSSTDVNNQTTEAVTTDKTAVSSTEDTPSTDVNMQTTATTSTDKTTVSAIEDK